MMKKRPYFLIFFQLLCMMHLSLAQNLQMVKDINVVAAGIEANENDGSAIVGSQMYFVKRPSELWRTDGTAAGTILVKHIVSTFGDSEPVT